MQEDEQVWQDEVEMMVTQELVANAMNDISRQAFEEEKRRIASQKKAAQATSTNQLSTDRPFVSTDRSFVSTDRSNTPNVSAASPSTGANADESSFVYLGGKIPIAAFTLPNVDLPIDPNMPDSWARLVDTDTESDLEEAPLEAEESQPLGSRVPLMSEEFEASEPSCTRTVSSHSIVSSYSTALLSPDHPLTHVLPTPTPFRLLCPHLPSVRGIDLFYEKQSSSSSSQTLPVRMRYQGTSEHILDTDSDGDELGEEDTEEDESSDADDEREGRDLDDVDPKDDRVYIDIPAYAPPTAPIQSQPSPEWSFGSLLVSPSSLVVPSPIASLVATLAATISVDEDQFIEVGVKLELYESILHDHTQRLDALPPTLFTDIDRDVRELYTRFDDHRLIYDMLVYQAAMQRELQEMRGRITTLEQERGHREQ
ncbi:hypothetical protein Tco_0311409 [Tanacetum coccineum]